MRLISSGSRSSTWKHVKRLKYSVQEIEWPTVSVKNQRVRWLSEEEEKAYYEALNPDRKWTKMPKKMTSYQKEGLASKSKPMPIHNVFLALGNIWLLEKYGFLQPDEFNGLMLAYTEG